MKETDRHIALTDLGDVIVSTISFEPGDLFARGGGCETMVFPAKDGEVTSWGDLDVEDYETAEEAAEGHLRMVAKWQKKGV